LFKSSGTNEFESAEVKLKEAIEEISRKILKLKFYQDNMDVTDMLKNGFKESITMHIKIRFKLMKKSLEAGMMR